MKVGIQDIINIIIMFQLLVFTAFLFVKRTNKYSNYLLGLHLFSQAAGILTGFCFGQADFFHRYFPFLFFAGYPFSFLWGPSFYLFIKSAAFSDFRIRWKQLIHFIPLIAAYIFLFITFFSLSFEEQQSVILNRNNLLFQNLFYFDIFIRTQVLFYILISIILLYSANKKLKENYSSSSQTNFAWIKLLVIGFTSCYALTIPFIIYNYLYHNYSSLLGIIVISPYFLFFNFIFFKAWYHPELFSGIKENVKYKSSKLTSEEAGVVLLKLKGYMEKSKPYLNPDLTLNQLAEKLSLQPRILSQVINEHYNQNFHDYINRLRVEESKRILSDPLNNKTILEILYDVGFNTKSAYNVAFKRATGFTPTEYRKKFKPKECE